MNGPPIRLQLSRRAGFRLQDVSRAANGLAAIIVARPGRWGNPFPARLVGAKAGLAGTAANALAVSLFERWIGSGESPDWARAGTPPAIENIRQTLHGHNLACWCPLGAPCHADVLIKLAGD